MSLLEFAGLQKGDILRRTADGILYSVEHIVEGVVTGDILSATLRILGGKATHTVGANSLRKNYSMHQAGRKAKQRKIVPKSLLSFRL